MYPQCKTCDHFKRETYWAQRGVEVDAPYGKCEILFTQYVSHEAGDECASDCWLAVDDDFGCIAHSNLEE